MQCDAHYKIWFRGKTHSEIEVCFSILSFPCLHCWISRMYALVAVVVAAACFFHNCWRKECVLCKIHWLAGWVNCIVVHFWYMCILKIHKCHVVSYKWIFTEMRNAILRKYQEKQYQKLIIDCAWWKSITKSNKNHF